MGSSETERVIRNINRVVAVNTDTSESEVATLFWHRLSIDIQRSAHRAFSRRAGFMRDGDLAERQGLEAIFDRLLQMPDGL